METCLIVGVGNCLLTDDGVGVHAVRLLAHDPPPRTQISEVGTDFMSAISLLEAFPKVLVIDAMDAGGQPGTLYRCLGRDIDDSAAKTSVHQLSLISMLEFIPLNQRPEILVLGVQPERIDYGLELSPRLAAMLPRVVQLAREIIAAF